MHMYDVCNCIATPLPFTTIYKHNHLKSNSKMIITFFYFFVLSLPFCFFIWLFKGIQLSSTSNSSEMSCIHFNYDNYAIKGMQSRVTWKGRNKPKYITTKSFSIPTVKETSRLSQFDVLKQSGRKKSEWVAQSPPNKLSSYHLCIIFSFSL